MLWEIEKRRNMKARFAASAVAAAVLIVALAPLAGAQASLVQFTTSSTGSRTVTLATPPTFPAQDLSLTGGDVNSTVDASTTLTEVFATGSTWSVKAQMCAPDSYASPTAANCSTGANQMVRAAGGALGDRIEGSTISVIRGTPTVTGTPVGNQTAPTAATDLSAQITLLSSDNEVATTTYNGVYSVTTDLTINDLTRTGTWKGYWVITQTT